MCNCPEIKFISGMFPWVCLATMPLFYPFHWPNTNIPCLKDQYLNFKKTIINIVSSFKFNIVCNCHKNDIRNKDVTVNEDTNNVQEQLHTRNTSNNVITNEKHADYNGTGTSTEEKITEHVNEDQNKTKHNEEKPVTQIKMDKKDHSKKVTTLIIVIYVLTQAFLPCSHFITKVSLIYSRLK